MGGGLRPGLLLWVEQFSLPLVALALVLCLAGSYAVMVLLRRARMQEGRRRLAWFAGLCLCFGADVWATHFIAMLSFDPGLPVYYNPRLTFLSVLAAAFLAAPAFAIIIWRSELRGGWTLAGLFLGGAIAVMHFSGMSAMVLCGMTSYRPGFQLASILGGMVLSVLALRAKKRAGDKQPVLATLLLVAAICFVHFTAMGGLVITPKPGGSLAFAGVAADNKSIAIAIAGVSLLVLVTLVLSANAEAKLAERQVEARLLHHLARHEDLTGLLNRRGLREKLDEPSVTLGPRPMLLCIGLDRLKPVTDLFGRELVDKLLCQAAGRLAGKLQDGDILAQPSRDEFVVLRTGTPDLEQMQGLARTLIHCLSEPFIIDGVTAQIGASAGLVSWDGAGERAEALLSAADIALREAIAAGGGQVRLFTAEMSATLLRRHQLEQEFQAALRNHEFELFYQPLFECRTLKLRGFEALARWQHPARGMIGPVEFIPVAEAGGMIIALGDYVLEAACRAACLWPENVRVAVNLSPIQLKDPGWPERVKTILAKTGLNPHRLELELTEGAVLEHTVQVRAALAALKANGVGLAIDDFGAGYSSLSYLHRFSFERLKIDKSFTREITASPDARIVTKAIIGLGAALGMGVLAEGVETEAQLNILRQAGCGQVQGFLLGRPMPEADVAQLLARMAESGGAAVLA